MPFIAFRQHSGALDSAQPKNGAFAQWNEEFSVGVGKLDRQHREIFDAVDALYRATRQADESATTGSLLVRIADLTYAHFASEEYLMAHTEYPGTALHVLKHEDLRIQLNALLTRFNEHRLNLDDYALKFLSDWLNKHIKSEDLNFALWLNEKGMR